MKRTLSLSLILAALLNSGCATLNTQLKAGPIEASPFAARALASASHQATFLASDTQHSPFHLAYRAHDKLIDLTARPAVYVAPVELSYLKTRIVKKGLVRPDASGLGEYVRKRVEQAFASHSVEIVSERPTQGRIIELALVEASPTDVPRNVLGTVLGAVVPGGGLVAIRSSGSIAIEGLVRDAASGEVLFVFADRERGKTAPFSSNDFTFYSHARAAIDDWAEQLAEVCTTPEGTRIADSSAITLLPL